MYFRFKVRHLEILGWVRRSMSAVLPLTRSW